MDINTLNYLETTISQIDKDIKAINQRLINFEKRFNVEVNEFYGAVDGGGYILGPFFQKNV